MAIFIDLTFHFGTKIDITNATVTDIHFTKPSGATGVWVGEIESAKLIKYEVQEGDLDETGDWKAQTSVVKGGREAPGLIIKFTVLHRLVKVA